MNTFCVGLIGADLIKLLLVTTITKSEFILLFIYNCNTEGVVEAGMELVLRDRPFPQWTIARANQIMHHDLNNQEAAAELASCPFLAPNWQRTLLNRAAKNINPDSALRLWGEN
ncbi:3-alpha domain-containing protein [Chroococcidiopsis sp. SAG 2025]|uniref:3-alpha domain-containing protein n=1 Tax=Chroococcidiopsis sp. SAG 2025 TaxID=171389 RepID=UPI002937121F|nr:3-alpha domain-containing protein [Chroococcidiopsis sp. SAG 2025]